MEKELIDFVKESKLSPFEKTTGIKMDKGMFKTKEAREIYSRVIEKIEKNFNFQSTLEIINYIGKKVARGIIATPIISVKSIAVFGQSSLPSIHSEPTVFSTVLKNGMHGKSMITTIW